MREQRGVLRNVSNAAMAGVDDAAAVVDDPTGDRDAAAVDAFEPGDHAQQSRLAAA